MFTKLRERIERYGPISDALWFEMLESIKMIEVPRQEILVHHNTCYPNLYYILEGGFKISHILEDGSCRAIWFNFSDRFDFVGAVDCFLLQEPTKYEITALQDSKVLRLAQSQVDDWIDRYPEFCKALLRIFQFDFLVIAEAHKYMMSHSAADIFKYIQKKFPHFMERLPSYLIAEFMGITPEWYSKMLKRV